MAGSRIRDAATGAAVGAAVTAAAILMRVSRHGRNMSHGSEEDEDENSARPPQIISHPAARLGLPQTTSVHSGDAFIASFDFRTRNPAWVIERLVRRPAHVSTVSEASSSSSSTTTGSPENERAGSSSSPVAAVSRRFSSFHEDAGIPFTHLRSTSGAYAGSGYDRGHLAPAADHRTSQSAMDATFNLSNISPQVGVGFNRDYWARFERFIRDVAEDSSELFVTTGPLFLPSPDQQRQQRDEQRNAAGNAYQKRGMGWRMSHALIGRPPTLVAVPTHFYKLVVAHRGSSNEKHVAAFVLPNAPIDERTPLRSFLVPIDALESVAGAKFHAGILGQREIQAINGATERHRAAVISRQQQPMQAALLGNSDGARASASNDHDTAGAVVEVIDGKKKKEDGMKRTSVRHLCDTVACELRANNSFGVRPLGNTTKVAL